MNYLTAKKALKITCYTAATLLILQILLPFIPTIRFVSAYGDIYGEAISMITALSKIDEILMFAIVFVANCFSVGDLFVHLERKAYKRIHLFILPIIALIVNIGLFAESITGAKYIYQFNWLFGGHLDIGLWGNLFRINVYAVALLSLVCTVLSGITAHAYKREEKEKKFAVMDELEVVDENGVSIPVQASIS